MSMSEKSIDKKVTTLDNGNKIVVLGSADNININTDKATIEFIGANNCLVIDKKAKLGKTKIVFKGSNSICYLNKTTNNAIKLSLDIYNDSTFFLGKGCSFNGILKVIVSETMNVLIGEDTMFSFGIWIRTSDVHLMYDYHSKERLNLSKDIIIGSHVWMGQSSSLLKGTIIGSGSVVGYGSINTKKIESNAVYVGQPSRKVRSNIAWDRESTNYYKSEDIELSYKAKDNHEKYYYMNREENLNEWQQLSSDLKTSNAYDRIDILANNELLDLVIKPIRKQTLFSCLFK